MLTFEVGSGEVDAVQCCVVHLTKFVEVVWRRSWWRTCLKGASKLYRCGIRLQAVASSCAHAHVLSAGQEASGMGANALVLKSAFFWCVQK